MSPAHGDAGLVNDDLGAFTERVPRARGCGGWQGLATAATAACPPRTGMRDLVLVPNTPGEERFVLCQSRLWSAWDHLAPLEARHGLPVVAAHGNNLHRLVARGLLRSD